ncbi:hypothetical protein [Serratia marcescens]|uniref:hypothetical protein n=1 Tax=Serratia marcescens TaxID=615 RepID=UPI000CCF6A5B|nr:hypothetical protein [Serratia marcescens]PNU31592.1 hypothetical protein C2M05_20600 [Serratia marcescens]
MKIFITGILALLGFSGSAVAACPDGNTVVTKSGYYAALNDESYRKMISIIESGSTSKLSTLLSEHSVIVLPVGIEVCITDRRKGFQQYRKHITIPNKPGAYWVPDAALNEIG